VLNRQLEGALADFAGAVRQDPAVLEPMLKKGADAIEESAVLAGLDEERTRDMVRGWMKQAHVALVEGAIERNPALALASLESGELDGRLVNDAVLIGRLTRRAERAKEAAETREKRAARATRNLFELHRAAHLKDVRETGRGDPEILALAGQVLDPAEMAALRDEEEAAQAHNATRERYAFMTLEEIAADIAARAPGGNPRDSDERQAAHETRTAARDAVLAGRRKDPAGWAMRDETVAAAFAAAAEAEEAAESPESALEDAQKTDRLHRRALTLRLQAQRDMGEEPRLLTEAERDDLAEEVAALTPTERLARLRVLRRRYGEHYDGLVKEMAGRVAPDTATLMAWAGDPALAGALARGMEMDAVEYRGARVPTLPLAHGRLDKSRLEDRQFYRFTLGERTVDVVYDRKADALVPALAEDLKEKSSRSSVLSATERAELLRRKEEHEQENPFLARFGQRLEAGGLTLRNAFGGMTLMTLYSTAIEAEARLQRHLEMMAEFEATVETRGLPAEQIATARALQERQKDLLQNLASSARQLAKQTVQDMAKTYGELAAIPRNPVAERAVRAESLEEFWDVFTLDPLGVIGQFGIEGLATAVPSIAGGILGGATGGPAGAAAGVGAGSALIVFGVKLNEKMLQLGAEANDPASYERVIREHGDEIRNYALKWAGIVGLFDSATAGVGVTRVVPRGGALSHMAEAGVQMSAQAGGAALGETVGQFAAGEELREGEIAAELVGEFVGGPAEIGSLVVTGARDKGGAKSESATGGVVPDTGAVIDLEEQTNGGESSEISLRKSRESRTHTNPDEDFPRSGTRKFLRPLVKQLPEKWRARFDLAEFMDRAEYPLPGQTAEQYFAPVWDQLDPHMKTFLDERFRNFAGAANERLLRDTLSEAGAKPSEKQDERTFQIPVGIESDGTTRTKTRVEDEVFSGRIRKVLLGLVAVPVNADGQTAIEMKLQSAMRDAKQRNNDKDLVDNKKNDIVAVEVLRAPAYRIKPEHLADVVDAWLNRPKRRGKPNLGKYKRKDVEDLVTILREQRGPDGKLLSVGAVLAITLSFALPLVYAATADDGAPPKEED